MVGFSTRRRPSPIGIDIGSRSIKLLQLGRDREEIVDWARWDLPPDDDAEPALQTRHVIDAIRQARQTRNFHGRKAVFCLSSKDLFAQNIRVPRVVGDELHKTVSAETAGRLPFPSEEAELRFVETDNVRQGDAVRREVIVLACHRPVINRILETADRCGLVPLAIDAQPMAMLRCYARQLRRDEDQQQRIMFVNLGASTTTVVIARGADPMFVKYLDIGGRHMDQALARGLNMKLPEASALRRHNGDRRADQRDVEVARSVAEALRPVLDQLANELSMCIRYHSVTFRGQPIAQVVLGGGEADPALAEWLGQRLDLSCALGDPLRACRGAAVPGRATQWDVAAGLALRGTED